MRSTLTFFELEDNNKLSFRGVLNLKKPFRLKFLICTNPKHKDRYLHFSSNHPPCLKRGMIISLVDRILKICCEIYIILEPKYLTDILFFYRYSINLLFNLLINLFFKTKVFNLLEKFQCCTIYLVTQGTPTLHRYFLL
jgi:hypothetical protein